VRLGAVPGIRYPEPMTADLFQLHPRLAADCRVLGDLPVCRLLLMNDARFPWVILVPRLSGLRELHDLPREVRPAVLDEIEAVSRALAGLCDIDKFNVGALGNLVPQLHVHVVGRRAGDAAWPGPVWGAGTAVPYDTAEEARLASGLRHSLAL
jgi:diadenosine tetraphosphate (Ap4A) HIT family hydrolase